MKVKNAVVYKDEGDCGPVWVVRDGRWSNYEDSELEDLNGNPRPEWFTRRQAAAIARREGLPLVDG